MFRRYEAEQFERYKSARDFFVDNPDALVNLEHFVVREVLHFVDLHSPEIKRDYNEASYLYPFWRNYAPLDRGRQARGDQYPWIEVGESVFGNKLLRHLSRNFVVRDAGLPSGSDGRCIISSEKIREYLQITDSAWIFVDVKSSGPRDDYPHAVMSPYQVSGSGNWEDRESGVLNRPIHARGTRSEHDFDCALSPIYILSDMTISPLVTLVVKPIYDMIMLDNCNTGQPLQKIKIACVPNGLLLEINPGYNNLFPGLFFPGKDDRFKDVRKIRARISFAKLATIAPWRVTEVII